MIGYGSSALTHDFYAYNAAGQVWNGSAFVTWADGSYASYRIAATQLGTSGQFTGTAPSGTTRYELRVRGADLAGSYVVWAETSIGSLEQIQNLLEADIVLALQSGVYVQKTLQRGTSTTLIPDKVIKQPSGTDLTNPILQKFGGAAEEPA